MTWVGLLLVGVGLADLARACASSRYADDRRVDLLAAAVVVGLGLLLGVSTPTDALALALVAAVVVAWGMTSRRRAVLPLAVLGGGLVAGLVLSPLAMPAEGVWARWVAALPWPAVADQEPDRVLLLAGVLLVQLATGNEVVRLVLAATGTVAPRVAPEDDPSLQLKGGRLLGPMERLVIVGLGLAGELTAASIVIAAKGLLRWPELSSSREQHAIHRLTEYFLVGSFVSWSVALAGLALGS